MIFSMGFDEALVQRACFQVYGPRRGFAGWRQGQAVDRRHVRVDPGQRPGSDAPPAGVVAEPEGDRPDHAAAVLDGESGGLPGRGRIVDLQLDEGGRCGGHAYRNATLVVVAGTLSR